MKSKIIRLVVLLSAAPLFAGVTATWTGAQDAYWTNAANWLVEGVVPAKCPGTLSDTVEPSGDIAVFDATCTSGRTTIDLDGLCSIAQVTVSGPECPQYMFGASTAQVLAIETNGVFSVASSVPAESCPVVNAKFVTGIFDRSWFSGASVGKMLTVRNDCAGALTFNSDFGIVRRREGSSSTYNEASIYMYGSGDFTFGGEVTRDTAWLVTYYCYQTGKMNVNTDFTSAKMFNFNASSRVVIAKNAKFGTYVSNNVGICINSGYTLTVEGEGTLRLAEHVTGSKPDNHGYYVYGSGYIDIYSNVECYNSSSTAKPRVILKTTTANAKRAMRLFCPPGNFPGGFLFRDTPQLVVATTNSLGNCPLFAVTNETNQSAWPGFLWEGNTEGESLAVPIEYLGAGNTHFVVANGGSVPFTMSSTVTVKNGSATLSLRGTGAPLIVSPEFADTVAMCLEGDVILPESTSLENCSSIELPSGANIAIEGSAVRTLPPVTVASGVNAIAFTDAATLTFSSLAITGGSLDIQVAGSGATVVFAGKTSADTPPAGLLLDGLVPVFTDSGTLAVPPAATDVSIAARGDTVPNAPGDSVGIASAGSGEADVLAADATAVKALIQQSTTPAEIAIGSSQTLTAEKVAIEHSAAALTVGTTAGQGALAAATSSIELRNESFVVPLTVKARLSSSGLLKTGAGEVVLAGGMAPAIGDMSVAAGTTTLSNGTWNTTSSSKLFVTNGATLVLGEGARLISDVGMVDVGPTVSTIEVLGGLLKIGPGAAVTNRIALNYSAASKISAVHQTGGDVYLQGHVSNNFLLLDQNSSFGYAQGCWHISGGTLTLTGRVAIAGAKGNAAIRQSGGRINQHTIFRLGAGNDGYADFIMTGGTNDFAQFNLRDWGGYPGTYATLTIDGEDAMFTLRDNMQAAYENNAPERKTCGILNLVRGTLRANSVQRGGNIATLTRSMSKAYVNFNGGTFKTRTNVGNASSGGIFGNTPAAEDKTWLDGVTIYAGGATIETDSDSRRVYVRTPFVAPVGEGIASIKLLGKRTGFIAPPLVMIEGDGEGASAYAVFDAEKGEVTGIRVASPGWGYTSARALLVTGSLYNYAAKATVCPVELADATSGSLTKAGPGTLVLAAANTYTGETVLKEGTVELFVPGALPAASTVAYEGGALTSKAAVFPASLKVRIPGAEDDSARRCVLATFTDACPAALPEVEVVNAPERAGHQWCVEFQGLTLCAKRLSGAVLIFR